MPMYINVRRISMVGFVLIYVINLFLQLPLLASVSYVFLLMAVLLTIPTLGKTNRTVSLTLIIFGLILLIYKNIPISLWLETFARNDELAAIFITIPLLSIPFRYGNYQEELKNFAKKYIRSPWIFCLLTWILTHLFGIIILIGSIPLVFQLFHENSKLYDAEKQFTSALIHGQISGGFWSPVWSSMIIMTYTLEIPWLQFVPVGFGIALIYLICGMTWIYFSLKRSNAHPIEPEEGITTHWNNIAMIVVLLLLPIFLIVTINYFSTVSVSAVIPVVSLVYPALMALILRTWKKFSSGITHYYTTRIFNVKNELALLTAAGFFGKTLELAGVQSLVMYLLPSNISQYTFFTIMSIMMVFVITVYMGLHPIVTGSALVVSIAPEALGLSPYMFGIVLLTGWALGILLSPFSATNMVAGGLFGRQSWYLSTKLHGLFGLSMLFVLAGTLSILARFL